MVKKSKGSSPQDRWLENCAQMKGAFPHASAWWTQEDEFRELRFKARDDGTTLAIAKGFDSGGGETVCFGSGYGLVGAMMAVDAAIQGGNWRVDKPWKP